VPGWRSSVYPAYHTLTGFQGGVATTLVILLLLRTVGGYRQYIGLEQFWGLAKLLLAFSLLWFYFWWSEFIITWYGRTPREQHLLQLLMFGPYQVAFYIAFACSFVLPFILLAWNRIRVSVLGPPLVALLPLTGLFFNCVRIYVSSFSIENVLRHELEHVPPTHFPDLADILLVPGGIAGAILVYMLATRVVPVLSYWEMQEGILLRAVKPLLRMPALVIGKPR
jgi:molybdopterin-containing oxidoreductase family membrane subunit